MTTPSEEVATTVTPGRTPPDPSVTAPRTRPWAGSAELDGIQHRPSSAIAASVNSGTCIETVLGLSMSIGSERQALQGAAGAATERLVFQEAPTRTARCRPRRARTA